MQRPNDISGYITQVYMDGKGAAVAATVTGLDWINVVPETPGSTVGWFHVNASEAMPRTPGVYSATLVFTPAGRPDRAARVPLTLTIVQGPALFVDRPAVELRTSTGTAATVQGYVRVLSSTFPTQWVSSRQNTTGTNTNVYPSEGETPTLVEITARPTGLPAGVYRSTVTFRSFQPPSTVVVPVIVTIDEDQALVSPESLDFRWRRGDPLPRPQVLAVSGSVPDAVARPCPQCTAWIEVTPFRSSLPGEFTVTVKPEAFNAGTVEGEVQINFGSVLRTVPVRLTVESASMNLSVSPAAITLEQTGPDVPAAQRVQVTGTAATTWRATWQATWLQITGGNGTLPGAFTVGVAPNNLANGTYEAVITVLAGEGTVNLPVRYVRNLSAAAFSAVPGALSLAVETGAATLHSAVRIAGAAGAVFTASTNKSWLTVSPEQGSLPADLTVSVNPAQMPAGLASATVTVVSAGSTLTVPVSVAVTAPATRVDAIVHGASYRAGPLAPGTLISLFGRNLGPDPARSLHTTTPGVLDTVLGGTRVLIGGAPAPLTYAGPAQINAIVPFGSGDRGTAAVTLERDGRSWPAGEIQLAASSPGLFTADSSGRGPAAVLNGDLSANSAANPVASGGYLVLYATGAGAFRSRLEDGAITGDMLAVPDLPVWVDIDGRSARVTYAGTAPGLVAGVLQINVQVPAGTRSGEVPVVVYVGAATSQGGVTAFVR